MLETPLRIAAEHDAGADHRTRPTDRHPDGRVQVRPGPTGSMCPPRTWRVLGERHRPAGPQDLAGDALGQREFPSRTGRRRRGRLPCGRCRPARRRCRSSRWGSRAGRPRAAGSVPAGAGVRTGRPGPRRLRSGRRVVPGPPHGAGAPSEWSASSSLIGRMQASCGVSSTGNGAVESPSVSGPRGRTVLRRVRPSVRGMSDAPGDRRNAHFAAPPRWSRFSGGPRSDTLTCMTVAAGTALPTPEVGAGIVMPIGGAEDKIGRMTVLREVVRLAGGSAGRMVVISTASSLGDEITHAYLQLFSSLGLTDVVGIRPESRAQSAAPDLVAAVDRATAVFMTGGNQVKLATLVVGTPLGEAILAAHRRGALVAGTSAGASILSAHMVSFGSGGATPKFRVGQVSQGLGLLDEVIVDQHFTQRNRFGRLLALIASNPAQLGCRHRRGHRGDHPAQRSDGGEGQGGGDGGRRHRRADDVLHRDRHPAADDVRGQAAHPAPRGDLRPDRAAAGVRAGLARHQHAADGGRPGRCPGRAPGRGVAGSPQRAPTRPPRNCGGGPRRPENRYAAGDHDVFVAVRPRGVGSTRGPAGRAPPRPCDGRYR